jgi:hypothetical protein
MCLAEEGNEGRGTSNETLPTKAVEADGSESAAIPNNVVIVGGSDVEMVIIKEEPTGVEGEGDENADMILVDIKEEKEDESQRAAETPIVKEEEPANDAVTSNEDAQGMDMDTEADVSEKVVENPDLFGGDKAEDVGNDVAPVEPEVLKKTDGSEVATAGQAEGSIVSQNVPDGKLNLKLEAMRSYGGGKWSEDDDTDGSNFYCL